MVLLLPCDDDGGGLVELALLLIDLLPPEAREALAWRPPAHMGGGWEEEAEEEQCTPHLALHPPSSWFSCLHSSPPLLHSVPLLPVLCRGGFVGMEAALVAESIDLQGCRGTVCF